jgi:1-acyl-sn-glycerol-3-phosphate acyltransferase
MTVKLLPMVLEAVNLKLHQLIDRANLVHLRKVFDALYFRRFVHKECACQVYHRERLPDQGPVFLVSSHSSHMDAGVIQTLFPLALLHCIRPSAARDHFTKGLVWHLFARGFMRLLFVDRGSGELAKIGQIDPFAELKAPLEAGQMIIVFPQGTRDTNVTFRSGIVHLARKNPGVPIIPILLRGTDKVLPKKASWFKAGPLKVYVGERYTFDEGQTASENARALEKYIYSLDQEPV